MEDLNKKIIFASICLVIAGCGVKGRPNPPQTPPPLGRGEPTYKDTKKKKSTASGTVSVDEGYNQ